MSNPDSDAIVMPRTRTTTEKIERQPWQSIAPDEQTIPQAGKQELKPTCAELIRMVSSTYYLERKKRSRVRRKVDKGEADGGASGKAEVEEEIVRKRPDYAARISAIVNEISKLLARHAELMALANPDAADDHAELVRKAIREARESVCDDEIIR